VKKAYSAASTLDNNNIHQLILTIVLLFFKASSTKIRWFILTEVEMIVSLPALFERRFLVRKKL
jgi:hypothetical protein